MPSTWTRRVAAPIAAATTAIAFLALGAGSATAAGSGLSVHQAKRLAHKLVVKQRRERSLLFTHLSRPHRRSSTRIDFRYEDRSTSDVLCVARIVVRQTSGKRFADLTGAKCHGIPSDILGFEDVTRALVKKLPDLEGAVRRSHKRYDANVAECDYVAVPKERAEDVDLLMSMGFIYALYKPLRARLGAFVQGLHDVHAGDPELTTAVESWDNFLILFDELDPVTHDPCGAVKQWQADGWTDESAPTDFEELAVERQQLSSEAKRLRHTSRYLAKQGVVRRTAERFDPDGIVDFFIPRAMPAPGVY